MYSESKKILLVFAPLGESSFNIYLSYEQYILAFILYHKPFNLNRLIFFTF